MNEQQVRQIAEQVYAQKANTGQLSSLTTTNHTHNGNDSPQISQANIISNTRLSGNVTLAQATTYSLGVNFNPTSIWFYGSAIRTSYVFTVTAANATIGATYTNSTFTFTVLATIAGGTTLYTVGTGTPGASGTLTKATGTGDATITFASNATQIITRAHCVGNCQIGSTFYLQPSTTTSVVSGGPSQNIIQSNSFLLVDSFNGGSPGVIGSTTPEPVIVRASSGEGHIVSVVYAGITPTPATSGIVARATILGATSNGFTTSSSQSNNEIKVKVVILEVGWSIIGNFIIT